MRMFLTPKWLASHAFVATMLVVMLAAGFWQLDRLDARKASNEEIRTASESPALPVEDLLAQVGGEVLPPLLKVVEAQVDDLVADGLLDEGRACPRLQMGLQNAELLRGRRDGGHHGAVHHQAAY